MCMGGCNGGGSNTISTPQRPQKQTTTSVTNNIALKNNGTASTNKPKRLLL